MNSHWWSGRKVLITGHTGFKGAWLCLMLQRLGADVHGYSLPPPTDPNLFDLAGLDKTIVTTNGDVRDLDKLTDAIKRSEAQIVFHMAAQSLVRESYHDPVGTYATNVMGTVNLLQAVRQAGENVRGVVVVSSDKCYENREWAWGYREIEPMGGHDPYSSSKGCAELVTAAMRDSFFQNGATVIASARAGNVIGGGDWARDRLIPDMVRSITAGKPTVIRNPQSIRPWQFVLEPLSGYMALAQKLVEQGKPFAEGWNFGPLDEDARPVKWIVDRVVQQWGNGAAWELAKEQGPHEANYLKLDASKSRARLDWRPRTNLATALQWTVDWYKAWQAGKNIRKFSEQQIEHFAQLAGECGQTAQTLRS